jgi:hypothetical protein
MALIIHAQKKTADPTMNWQWGRTLAPFCGQKILAPKRKNPPHGKDRSANYLVDSATRQYWGNVHHSL